MINIDSLLFGGRTRLTVKAWMQRTTRPITTTVLAGEIDSPTARELVRCAYELSKIDPDNEAGFDAAVESFNAAESAFLAAHSDTEVEL
jgi:hypothetical protein